jgi:hypothetical protein
MDCISGFSKYIDIVSKLFSTREYLKTNLTKLISVENTIFLSLFSEHVFIPEPEVHQWWKKPERTTNHGQATGKLYRLWLRVECTFL